jgi:hypothetical protein
MVRLRYHSSEAVFFVAGHDRVVGIAAAYYSVDVEERIMLSRNIPAGG